MGFDVKVVRLYLENVLDCDNLCVKVADFNTLQGGLARRLLKAGDCLEGNGSVPFQQDLFVVTQGNS